MTYRQKLIDFLKDLFYSRTTPKNLKDFNLTKFDASITFDGNIFLILFKDGNERQAIQFKLKKKAVHKNARMVAKRTSFFIVMEYEIVPEHTYYEEDWNETLDGFLTCLNVLNKINVTKEYSLK